MKLSLDKTWELCMEMWKWISFEVGQAIKADESWDVVDLKKEYLTKVFKNFTPHNMVYDRDNPTFHSNCFFCEYAYRKTKEETKCNYCPAVKFDKDFNCSSDEYYYRDDPCKFYKKLKELNKKRLAKKK